MGTVGMDKGTLIRTILLSVALINQVVGTTFIALTEAEITMIVEGMYLLISTLVTVVTALIAWFKNNYITKKGREQKQALKISGKI